ncbi:MAG: hypothetical protein KC486_19100, partial [Myxococcales bacterium]|nr:hypothetical protein [Myxococcales bacterium]
RNSQRDVHEARRDPSTVAARGHAKPATSRSKGVALARSSLPPSPDALRLRRRSNAWRSDDSGV